MGKRYGWGLATVALGLLVAVVATGAERPPRPPFGDPPGDRGRRQAGILGEITALDEATITVRPVQPPGQRGGGGGRPGRFQQGPAGAGPGAPEVTFGLVDETLYRILDTADEDAIDEGMAALAIGQAGEGEDANHLVARAMCLYAADDPQRQVLPLLLGTSRRLLAEFGLEALRQRIRPTFALGTIATAAPLVLRSREPRGGEERSWDIELTDESKLFVVDECLYEDLIVGQWALVMPRPPRDGDGADEPVAGIILQMEPVDLRALAGPRGRPEAPPAQ